MPYCPGGSYCNTHIVKGVLLFIVMGIKCFAQIFTSWPSGGGGGGDRTSSRIAHQSRGKSQ